jgi:hypothetical protein
MLGNALFYSSERWQRGCGQVDNGDDATAAKGLGRCQGGVQHVTAVVTRLTAQKTGDGSVVIVVVYRGTAADDVDEDDGDRARASR